MQNIDPQRVLNINVGVLGHVDSGKTSLVKALSTHFSTAALDKSKESQARGMTLDLGFSAFTMDMPSQLTAEVEARGTMRPQDNATPDGAGGGEGGGDGGRATGGAKAAAHPVLDTLQVTLVDCPGHASLIRTIIGGAQIIDLMLLVIDVTKGIQTQTAECLVIGEIMSDNLLVALNKVDLLPAAGREAATAAAEAGIRKALAGSKFEQVEMIPVASRVGGEKVAAVQAGKKGKKGATAAAAAAAAAAAETAASAERATGGGAAGSSTALPPSAQTDAGLTVGLDKLVDALCVRMRLPARHAEGPFMLSVDHCFQIRGQGTVLTGTVVGGSIAVNKTVEVPAIGVTKRIKSMQMFRRPVTSCMQGDRVGLCVAGLDANLVERGLVVSPGSMKTVSIAIAAVRRVRFFRDACKSGTKFHVSVGHSTTMASVLWFGGDQIDAAAKVKREQETKVATVVDAEPGAVAVDLAKRIQTMSLQDQGRERGALDALEFDWDMHYTYQEDIRRVGKKGDSGGSAADPDSTGMQWCLLRFDRPVLCPPHSMIIGSRLDLGDKSAKCRLAFYGRLCDVIESEARLPELKIFKTHGRYGTVDRVNSPHELVARDLFRKETDITQFSNMLVTTMNGEAGKIGATFGRSGKFHITFPKTATTARPNQPLVMRFRRYLFDAEKKMKQGEEVHNPISEEEVGANALAIAAQEAEAAAGGGKSAPKSKKGGKDAGGASSRKGKGTEAVAKSKVGSAAVGSSGCAGGATAPAVAKEVEAPAEPPKPRPRQRNGLVDKLKGDANQYGRYEEIIASGLFTMEEDISQFVGAVVKAANGDKGNVKAAFGKMGKCKVVFDGGTSSKVADKLTISP